MPITNLILNRPLRLTVFSALSLSLLMGSGGTAAAQAPGARDKVTICHRTASESNPYIMISTDVESVIESHLDHDQAGTGPGGDIIPEFTYSGETYSKNLDNDLGGGITGARILSRGCRSSKGDPTPSPAQRIERTTAPPSVPVPEPITILMFGTGLASVGLAARKRLGKKGERSSE